MEAAFAAARVGDPIQHSNSFMGMMIGAAIGFAVGLAIAAVAIALAPATGGLSLMAAVGAIGGVMAFTGQGALMGEEKGAKSKTPTGEIIVGDHGVIINDKPAARGVTDTAACKKDGSAPQKIAQGSQTVFINGYPAARVGDRLVCDGEIASGSPNVFIGADPADYLDRHKEVPDWLHTLAEVTMWIGTVIGIVDLLVNLPAIVRGLVSLAKAGGSLLSKGWEGLKAAKCLLFGDPVNIATGAVLSEETDFVLPGPLPLVWHRQWISSSSYLGELGHGWHHGYDWALEEEGERLIVRLGDGRLIRFAAPAPGRPTVDPAERLILKTDGHHWWLVDYDGRGYHFGAADPDGIHHLVRVNDPNQNAIVLERNDLGGLTGLIDSAGRRLSITHDEAGRITAIDAPHPDEPDQTLRLVSYRYDAAGDLVESEDANGHRFAHAYTNHLMAAQGRPDGITYRFTWDDPALGPKARCIETTGDGGLLHYRFAYDVEAQVTTVTSGTGAVWVYDWDQLGHVTREVDPLGGITRQFHDEHGNLVRRIGPAGQVTRFGYDALGRQVERIDAAGNAVHTAYAVDDPNGIGHGSPSEIIVPGDAPHGFRYDARGNLARYTDPTGNERRYARDTRGLPLTLFDPVGVARRFTWDAEGNLAAEATGRGVRTRYAHDRLGRIVAIASGEDAPTRLIRDAKGDVVEIRRPDGGVIQLERNADGAVTRHRDPLGRETRWDYGGLPYPTKRTTADGRALFYAYDADLNLVGLTNQKGERYRLELDALGRLAREVGFDGRERHYRYDAASRLVELNDQGRRTRFERDPLGRLLRKTYADDTIERFEWDAAGRLTLAENTQQQVEFGYDRAGRLILERQGDQAFRHGYDGRGRPVGTVLPDGRRIETGWGEDDRPQGLAFAGAVVARFAHDAAGREVDRIAGAVRRTQSFDPQGRLVAQRGGRRAAAGGGVETLFSRDYAYDRADALVAIEDARRGLKRFRYDETDRLLAVDGADPESFVVDPAGNILASGQDGAFWGGEAPGDRLLLHGDRKFEYDAHGNRIKEYRAAGGAVEVTYRYDAADRLVEADEASRLGRRLTRFGYDALGRRLWKESTQLPMRPAAANDAAPVPGDDESPDWHRADFLWTGDVLRAESGDAADPLATIYLYEPASFRPLAQVRRGAATTPGAVYHYHLDHLGTPQELTNDNGDLVWAADLKAWGGVRRTYVEQVPNPLRFQGQYHDTETGLHYNRYRYYSPDEGCFIGQDPIRLAGGSNIAAYVPNPVQWIDPLGLACLGGAAGLARETGAVDYGTLDALGRPTGVKATITQDMIGTGTDASRKITPPGWSGNGTEFNEARGHLLGKQLGGSGTEPRNLVTLEQNPVNTPVMRDFETEVRNTVESGQVVNYSATPIYSGDNLAPRAVTLLGQGSDGYNLGVSVLNPIGK